MTSSDDTVMQIRQILDSAQAQQDQRDRLEAEKLLALRHSRFGIVYVATAFVLVGIAAWARHDGNSVSIVFGTLSAVVLLFGAGLFIRGSSRLHTLAGRLRRRSGLRSE